jgi:hypothetical protein
MATQEKLYGLKGTVKKTYEPREFRKVYGGKEVVKHVSDMYLILETGSEVKVSFWDIDISAYGEGAVIKISSLSFKGKYKEMPQWSSTKNTKIEQVSAGKEAPEAQPEEEMADGAPEEVIPEGAQAEGEEEAPAEMTASRASAILKTGTDPVVAKPAAKPAAKAAAPVAYTVNPKVIEATVTLASVAMDIVDRISNDLVKSDAQAYQALFATIFIELGKKDYSSRATSVR